MKNELTKQEKFDNFLWTFSWLTSALLVPIFVFNITRATKSGKYIVKPVKLSYFIPKGLGLTPATIEHNALWINTIPSMGLSMQWVYIETILGREIEILVPETQAFIADVRLRQWCNSLKCIVTSVPQTQNGIPSTRYEDKLYQSRNIRTKDKAVDTIIGNFLWKSLITEYKVPKRKKAKLGKTYG